MNNQQTFSSDAVRWLILREDMHERALETSTIILARVREVLDMTAVFPEDLEGDETGYYR